MDDVEQMFLADGFDDCIIGLCSGPGQPDVIAYDLNMMIGKLMDDGMSQEEAWEWYNFNILGSYLGEGMPVYIDTSFSLDDLEDEGDCG